MISDLGVGGIHPYSGASALANRWLWGPGGCQLYSVAGFIFGDLQVSRDSGHQREVRPDQCRLR